MKKKWRLGVHYNKEGYGDTVQIQFLGRDNEWQTQSQYDVIDGMVSVNALHELTQIRELDYEQTYSVKISDKEVW